MPQAPQNRHDNRRCDAVDGRPDATALARMAYMRVDSAPESHLLHHEQGRYVKHQRFEPDEGVRPQAPADGVNGRGIVPSSDHARTDHEQDTEQTRGSQAQPEIAPSLSPELPECVGGGP